MKSQNSIGLKAISRATFIRVLVVAGVLAAGVVTVRGLESALHATFDKPPAPLQHPLPMMRRTLGTPVRYEAVGPDGNLSADVIEELGTPDFLLRQYRDRMEKPGENPKLYNLNVNYYSTGSSSPHVPEICWAGSGRQEAPESRAFFDVKDVRRRDGTMIDLRMRMISFSPTAQDVRDPQVPESQSVYVNVAYVFHVNGDYVANPQEVTSRFWKAGYRYAYHAKIEVTPTDERGNPLASTQERSQKAIAEFIRYVLPEVEECLPDPKILTAPSESEKH